MCHTNTGPEVFFKTSSVVTGFLFGRDAIYFLISKVLLATGLVCHVLEEGRTVTLYTPHSLGLALARASILGVRLVMVSSLYPCKLWGAS